MSTFPTIAFIQCGLSGSNVVSSALFPRKMFTQQLKKRRQEVSSSVVVAKAAKNQDDDKDVGKDEKNKMMSDDDKDWWGPGEDNDKKTDIQPTTLKMIEMDDHPMPFLYWCEKYSLSFDSIAERCDCGRE